ncbi:MAG: AmiS/UreI family transporter, partial [Romboutsia sp.]|uniref:AmiS/UreI family transporter n=1 Tax=Romboutsia sp. TaxID=1965302 RepID=UPI003F32E225
LLYVGFVLMINGIGTLTKIPPKSTAIMNIFTGGLSIVVNFGSLLVAQAQNPTNMAPFYAAGTGLLFGFTYLFIGINSIFNLDSRTFAWYSLFVAITTVPAGVLQWREGGIWNILMALIWWAWGILWVTAPIETLWKKNLGKFTPWLSIVEGIFTAWIPGFLLLMNVWK